MEQPDEYTCGPVSLKIALSILGIKKSIASLIKLCQTTTQGTTTAKMIQAVRKLGLYVMVVDRATLRHIQSGLKFQPSRPRALIVSYLYYMEYNNSKDMEYEHWATVASYLSHKNRLVLFDSYSVQKKSYSWTDFRQRWIGYELKRIKHNGGDSEFKYIRRRKPQQLLIITRNADDMPKFKPKNSLLYYPIKTTDDEMNHGSFSTADS